MKKYYEYLGLIIIMVFSFYYTEQIASIVLNKNPLMIKINNEKENYQVESVNAIIEGDYITPGINGLKVNAKDSFYRMEQLNTFNAYYLIFDEVKPLVSLQDNKDKIIKNGNKNTNKVSLILEEENNISTYLKNNNIKANLLVNLNTYKKNNYFESINNDLVNFKSLENNLNLNKENKNICVLNNELKNICLKYHNYLIEPTLELNSTNYLDVKKNLQNGTIILIKSNAKLIDIKMLLKSLSFKNLNIVPLSELISEKNS